MPRRSTETLFALLGLLLQLYLFLPIGYLFWRTGSVPLSGLADPEAIGALMTSIKTATIATVVIGLFGVPFGYVLARLPFPGRSLVRALVLLPLTLPPLVGGILLIMLLGPYAPLGSALARLGLQTWDSAGAIVLAQIFVASPFVIVTAHSAFEAVDPILEQVAATLGRNRWQAFWTVALPLAWPGIVAGLLLAWVRSLGEFGATMVMAYHPYSLPVYTWVQISSTGLDSALPLALLAVLAGLLAIGAIAVATSAASQATLSREWLTIEPAERRCRTIGQLLTPESRSRSDVLSVSIRAHRGSFHLDLPFPPLTGITVLFGPSGAGKSLTLQTIAGLLRPTAGRVSLGNTVLFDAAKGIDLPAYQRRVGYVLQGNFLFPHLTVRQNVAFGLPKPGSAATSARLTATLEAFGLEALADRRPSQLSGGQQQRVGLARAVATNPSLLLLDEPFSALDGPVREEMRDLLLALQRQLQIPTIFVTHDLTEAAKLADTLVVIVAGQILQIGSPDEVIARPRSRTVARLAGARNIVRGQVISIDDGVHVRTERFGLVADSGPWQVGQWVDACVRPEQIRLVAGSPKAAENRLHGSITREWTLGAIRTLYFSIERPDSGGGRASADDAIEVAVSATQAPLEGWRLAGPLAIEWDRQAVQLMEVHE